MIHRSASLRPWENITGGAWLTLPWSRRARPLVQPPRLRDTAGAPARRADHPPRAPLARSRRATRDLRAGSPPTPVGGEGGSPVPVPCRASPGPPDCQCAHCAPGLTPSPQEDCAVPDHRPVPLRDCYEARAAASARGEQTAPSDVKVWRGTCVKVTVLFGGLREPGSRGSPERQCRPGRTLRASLCVRRWGDA